MTAEPYREHAPAPALRPYVECFWTRGAGDPAAVQRVLPDGCVDILFELDAAPRAWVIGAMTRPLEARAIARMLAVRFRPGGAEAFLGGAPLHELTDRRAELDALWRLPGGLLEQLAAGPAGDGVDRWQAALLARLPGLPPPDPRLRRAMGELGGDRARSVEAAAASAGWSRQYLGRRCREATGLGPKLLQRVLRLRRTLELIDAGTAGAALAAAAGFADQAHLGHEMRALTGLTPRQLAGRGSA